MAMPSPTSPMTRGAIVWALLHGNWVPPQDMATKNNVAEAMKMKPPIQSTRASFSPKVDVLGFSVRRPGIATKPKPMKGNMM